MTEVPPLNVVVFGATGMVGSGVLLACLDDERVGSVLAVGRNPSGINGAKLTEIVHEDLFDLQPIESSLAGLDACFFCLGVSAVGTSEHDYARVTVDLTLAVASTLTGLNPDLVFCYVSGQGTDSSEAGRIMWARVKGRTENRLFEMPFGAAYALRPGYIQPVKGVRSKTPLYRAVYTLVRPAYPILKRLFPRHVMTSEELGLAMIQAAVGRPPSGVLEPPAIRALASRRHAVD